MSTTYRPEDGLFDAILAAGMPAPNTTITYGAGVTRWGDAKGKGGKPYWLKAHLLNNGHIAATFGDWRTGRATTYKTWENGHPEDPAAAQRLLDELTRRQKLADEEAARAKAATAKRELEIWDMLPEEGDREYLIRKKVGPYGIRYGHDHYGKFIAVPMRDISRTFRAFQRIYEDGRKHFPEGAAKKGAYHLIDTLEPNGVLYLAEGYATAATVHEATGKAVAVCFDSGNLRTVADALKAVYPGLTLIMAADNDQWKADELDSQGNKKGNAGVKAARTVARAHPGTKIAIPSFENLNVSSKPTDFNDLAQLADMDAVRMQIAAADIPPAEKGAPTEADPIAALGLSPDSATGVDGFANIQWRKGTKNGLHAVRTGEDGEPVTIWLCGPIEVRAIGRGFDNTKYAIEIEFDAICGAKQTLVLPRDQLLGDGAEALRQLAGAGLDMVRRAKPLGMLLDFLHEKAAKVTPIRIAEQTGWRGNAFILPDAVFGARDNEPIVFRPPIDTRVAYGTAGTLAQWQQQVAAPCIGNSRLILSVSTAFASMLLELVRQESGGVHLQGPSSIGKTIALMASASVFGHGRHFIENWRTTDNGLESLAVMHDDTLLPLDELGQLDPRVAGESAYMLANGQGKSRANRYGGARERKRWRLMVLSSGELSLSDLMQSVGKTAKAGQEVRLITVPADTGKFGLFENLHGMTDGAQFAQQLSAATQQFYGTASHEFLQQLVDMPRDEVVEELLDYLSKFIKEYLPKGAEAQVGRFAERFALIAAAGEFASAMGITGWPDGASEEAVATCLEAAIKARGGLKQQEEIAALRQVRKFFEQHGESRFTLVGTSETCAHTQNRAGFRETAADGSVSYYVFPENWRSEICKGFDPGFVTSVLKRRGYLELDSEGRSVVLSRVSGQRARMYHVYGSILSGGATDEDKKNERA